MLTLIFDYEQCRIAISRQCKLVQLYGYIVLNNNNWIHVETYRKTMMLSLTPPSPPAPTKVKKA